MLCADVCKGGWVGIALGEPDPQAYSATDTESLIRRVEENGPPDVVAIDIPIGLPDAGRRRADEMAKAEIGARRSS